ncbi:hypothetical protein PR202_ga25778 [Eleusine coracana subsp. coracana]|uniref:HMA domain-containing protein n=1 Tax=Eleusine coracana subsp. coracana TaxID=191504 RepID=A0AAV5DCG7_ELECO|nr:hypothetical protein QOZ80_3AG0247940 [Eleusine coracana subsp. coracana]GJN07905.1 hypothetical protein PR202_ga25778 [Eleusine coracana subsp. coracana]
MASGEAAPAATQMQTVVLKVSIHCHGCKKKVRKVLRSVEGVHNVTVDAAQHKVTVTGTVDADTLVKRLYKSGKQALLLAPHGAPPKKPEPAAPAPPPPAPAPAKEAAAPPAAEDKKPEEPVKPAAEPAETKKPEPEAAEKKPAEAEPKKEEAKPSEKEAKKDDGEKAAEPKAAKAVDEPPVKAKEAGNDVGEAKKSKKPEEAAAPPVTTAERTLSAPLPRHGMYEEQHYYPPQPVLSYHAAQPRQSVSYYAPQPQQHQAYSSSSMQQQQPAAGYGYAYPMHEQPPPRRAYSMEEAAYPHQQPEPMMKQWSPSYLYMPYPHSAPESYYQHQSQADYYSPPGSHAAPPPLQDSYSMFDDENPNACSVM